MGEIFSKAGKYLIMNGNSTRIIPDTISMIPKIVIFERVDIFSSLSNVKRIFINKYLHNDLSKSIFSLIFLILNTRIFLDLNTKVI